MTDYNIVKEGGLLEKMDELMKGGPNSLNESKPVEFHGVRITPGVLKFLNAFMGQEYAVKVNFLNTSSRSVVLRIGKPFSWAFSINDEGSPIVLSSGLSVTRVVAYRCSQDCALESKIPVHINQWQFNIPIVVEKGTSYLKVCPLLLNFGMIDLGCRFISKTLYLANEGACTAKYEVDFGRNPLDLLATPKKGNIPPFGNEEIKIEMAGFVAGELYDEFWVKGYPPHRVEVEVYVLLPYLQAIHPNTTGDFTLMDFKATYFGTARYETVIVRNVSAFQSSFVVLAEINNELCTVEEARTRLPVYKNFSIIPKEGIMGPFEGRIFTIQFKPSSAKPRKGWKHLTSNVEDYEYLCFLRILRVDVVEVTQKETEKYSEEPVDTDPDEDFEGSPTPTVSKKGTLYGRRSTALDNVQQQSEILRLCLHGDAVKPDLQVIPDSLTFDGVTVGTRAIKVLQLKNFSSPLPLGYRYRKIPGVQVTPQSQFIPPRKQLEITVTYRVTSLGMVSKKLVLDVISYEDLTAVKNIKAIGKVTIDLIVNIISTKKEPAPQFNLGITPFIAHEAGVHTELVCYKSDVQPPKGVCMPKDQRRRPWLKSDALIALPNDRSGSFRVKPTDVNVRSIFTGTKRYIAPPDPDYTYNKNEFELIEQHKNKYKEYCSELAEVKRNVLMEEEDPRPVEYSVSDEKLYQLLGLQGPVLTAKDYCCLRKPPEVRGDTSVLCPLTPMDLYNIMVMPKTLDYGKIPPFVDCVRKIRVDNFNNFPVTIKLMVQKTAIKLTDDVFVVGPRKRVEKEMVLNLESYGKYYSNVSYMVNNSHSFDMKLSADVVHRTLSLSPKELTFSTGKAAYEDIFQVKWAPVKIYNSLYVPTRFHWKVPTMSPYTITPLNGTVPGNSCICCAIHFNLKMKAAFSANLQLIVEEGTTLQFRVYYVPETSQNVSVLLQKLVLPPLCLNIPYKEGVLFFNAGFKDVVFSVLTQTPFEGVSVRPITGIIQARACLSLEVEFNIKTLTNVDFVIRLEIQGHDVIEAKIIGHTVYPEVNFNPKRLVLRSTPCFSFDVFTMTVENKSPALAQVQFDMQDYPQIKLSPSKYYKGSDISPEGFLLQPNATKKFFLHFQPKEMATYEFYLPTIVNQILGPPVLDSETSLKTTTYIKIVQKTSRIMKTLSYPPKLDFVRIDCSVQRGLLEFSSTEFNFVVTDRNRSASEMLHVKNIRGQQLNFFFDTASLMSGPFEVQCSGDYSYDDVFTLMPMETLSMNILFEPVYTSVFEIDVPVYVAQYSRSKPYNLIKMKGVYHKSVVYSNTKLIQFLPVPLNVETEKSIEIVAAHQYRDTLLYGHMRKIEETTDIIEFIFPKGNHIPKNDSPITIPVKMKFKSKKPITYKGNLMFTDDQDGECIVSFTATADHCALTSYIYLFLSYGQDTKIEEKCSYIAVDSKTSPLSESLSGSIKSEDALQELIKAEVDEFPKFPKSSSTTPFAEYMRRVLISTENWLFEQGLCCSFRMVLGEHVAFTKEFNAAFHSRSKNNNYSAIKSIIEVLVTFVGRELLLQYNIPTLIPEETIPRVHYCVSVYRQILLFLRVQGGSVSHIFAAHLLCYEDYLVHYNEVKDKLTTSSKHYTSFQEIFEEQITARTLLSPQDFERFSLQAWLDLILQVYKCVVLSSVVFMREFRLCLSDADLSVHSYRVNRNVLNVVEWWCGLLKGSFTDLQEANTVPEHMRASLDARQSKDRTSGSQTMSDRAEKLLLTWMNTLFQKKRIALENYHIPPRNLVNFTTDLEDAVVLTLVTLFYCPYLQKLYLNDFYFNPTDFNQYQHNAALLTMAWTSIRLGMTVTPHDFAQPCPAFMVMLVTHLYTTMRSYVPQTMIQFLTCLSLSVIRKITVTNPTINSIGYSVKILGDPNGFFSIEKPRPLIVIPPKQSTIVSISFFARKISPVKAILLLCGTCMASGYVNNIAFYLQGEPFKLVVLNHYVINAPLYKPTFINANIISPYDTEGMYDIWYAEEEPKPGKFNFQMWSKVKQRKLPRILYLGCSSLIVPPSSSLHPAILPLTAACYTMTVCQFWIIFINREVGDFIVKVSIKPRTENPLLILPLNLPTGVCTGSPSIRCTLLCPRTIRVYIPCRNARLWTTIRTMFSLTVEKKEQAFWDSHLETRIGLELVKWMLGDKTDAVAREIEFIFNSKVTYNISCESSLVEFQPSVTIEDVHKPNFVEVLAHVCCKAANGLTTMVRLESEKEVRLYRLTFKGKPTPSRLIQACKKCHSSIERPSKKVDKQDVQEVDIVSNSED